jgi:conjugal transfer/type IV secretion protein DotA/TraY
MLPMEQSQRNNLISADSLVEIISNQNRAPSAAVTFEQAGVSTANAGYYQMQGVLSIFMEDLTLSETDPIYSIAKSGYKMMISAQLLFASFAVAAAITAAVSSTTSAVIFGNGVPQGPGLAALNMIFKFLGPLMMLLVSTLFTVGALLGVYVPLIPYIVFTVTSIGWFIGVIEAMVAAPFIALGIMSPGGQHELMSRAEPSIMILFNLFLRPTLMVFGMLAAMLLASVVVRIINSAFSQVMYQIISNPGLIEQIVFMCAYTILIITALSKCFSLIHMLPERTLTYIGGHAIQYGEEQALQAVKGGVEAASSAMMKSGQAAAIAGAKAKGQPEGKEGKMKGSAQNTPATPDDSTKSE